MGNWCLSGGGLCQTLLSPTSFGDLDPFLGSCFECKSAVCLLVKFDGDMTHQSLLVGVLSPVNHRGLYQS